MQLIPHGFLTLVLKERKVEGMSTNFAVHSPNVLHLYIEKEEVMENELVPLGEMLIADVLDDLHLEYKYEVLYLLNPHRKIIPDFVVLIPALGRFFFIEFMGMADDPNYMDNNSSRIENYIRNGIYPGRDLLIIVGNRDYLPTVNAVKRRIISFINDLTLDSVLIP